MPLHVKWCIVICGFWGGLEWTCIAAAEESANGGRVRFHVKAIDPLGGKCSFEGVQIDGLEAKIIDAAAAIYDDNSKKWLVETYIISTKPGAYAIQVTVKNDAGVPHAWPSDSKNTRVASSTDGTE